MRFRRLFRLPSRSRAHAVADADEELRAFLAERVDDLMALGMTAEEARAEALRRLGASVADAAFLLQTSATSRERRMRTREVMGTVIQDLRYAVRALRREVGFTTFAVAIIGLGVGASATVFSVANALLLRPLPFTDPERLAWIPNGGGAGLSAQTAQVAPYLSYVDLNQSFSEVAAYFAFYGVGDTRLTGDNGVDAVRLSDVPVTRNFFPLLGVRPVLGRGFTAEESVWNGPKVVLISHSLWELRFASDPAIVGRTITLNDEPTTVVGIMPAWFDFGSVFAPGAHIDLFTPFPLTPETSRWGNTLSVVARLKSGATIAGARSGAHTAHAAHRDLESEHESV